VAGDRATEAVENFPLFSVNYWKALARLKARFGRDLLVEVYLGKF
jgi:hypothetical protein